MLGYCRISWFVFYPSNTAKDRFMMVLFIIRPLETIGFAEKTRKESSMTSELKPCPFCGGEGALNQYTNGSFSVTCVNDCSHIEVKNKYDLLKHMTTWNTRTAPDVPELVRYDLDYEGGWGEGAFIGGNPDGEYVRYDQAAAIIAAKDAEIKRLQRIVTSSEQERYRATFSLLKRAEAAEAKLSEYEKQEPVAWQHAVTYPDGVKYIGVISKESKQQSRPLYASPAPMPSHGH